MRPGSFITAEDRHAVRLRLRKAPSGKEDKNPGAAKKKNANIWGGVYGAEAHSSGNLRREGAQRKLRKVGVVLPERAPVRLFTAVSRFYRMKRRASDKDIPGGVA